MDISAEDKEEASEEASGGVSVDRVTPASSVVGLDTGPSIARGEVIQSHPHTQSLMFLCDTVINTLSVKLRTKKSSKTKTYCKYGCPLFSSPSTSRF